MFLCGRQTWTQGLFDDQIRRWGERRIERAKWTMELGRGRERREASSEIWVWKVLGEGGEGSCVPQPGRARRVAARGWPGEAMWKREDKVTELLRPGPGWRALTGRRRGRHVSEQVVLRYWSEKWGLRLCANCTVGPFAEILKGLVLRWKEVLF